MNTRRSLLVVIMALIAVCAFGVIVGYAEGNEANPSYAIVGVTPESVTLRTSAFPAETNFSVNLKIDDEAAPWVTIAKFNSGIGGNFSITANIPETFGDATDFAIMVTDSINIAIEASFSTTAPVEETDVKAEVADKAETCDYSVLPYFMIDSVKKGKQVTLTTADFPKDKEFTVKMGYYACAGSLPTAKPPKPKANEKVSYLPWMPEADAPVLWPPSAPLFWSIIAEQAPAYFEVYADYLAWLASQGKTDTDFYSGWYEMHPNLFPYWISDNDYFGSWYEKSGSKKAAPSCPTVFVGTKVGTYDSADGAPQTVSYEIPEHLAGMPQIHVRIDENAGCGFYAYNYFWNNDYNPEAPAEVPTVEVTPAE